MQEKFPGFKKCMAMMRNRNSQVQEDGFHWLQPHALEHVHVLIEEFGGEKVHGLRCWLLELIGTAKSQDAFNFLREQLCSDDGTFRRWAIWGLKNLNTNESRTLLWQAPSFTFGSMDETEEFRQLLENDFS